jgi:hypothetical protein
MNKELLSNLRESAATKIIGRLIDDPDTQKLAAVLIPTANSNNRVFNDFMEKFAELIVRECASVVDYYHTRNEPVSGRNVKQHFGVE